MRQAYDYWQDQPGSYQTDVPSTSTSVSSLPRAQRHHRCWLVHARRLAPRLSAARQYCTARAGREFAPSRAPLPFQFSVLPAPENLGSHQRQVTPSSDRSEETADFVGVRRRRQHRGQHTTGKNRANTDRSLPAQRPERQPPKNTRRASRPTRSNRTIASRVATTLAGRSPGPRAPSTVTQSPKWPPRTLMSVIVS